MTFAPLRFPFKMVCMTLAALTLFVSQALAFDTSARAAYVLDQTTGTVLLDKNANLALPPASMSKLMTLYVAFEALRDGRLTLSEKLPVSQHAMSFGGSTMFLDTTDRVSVEDLLRGIIVLSGNDACVVIAEALSPDGTEAGFARFMTQRAGQLGMEDSTFVNSTGWPADDHKMSMKDLVTIADLLITEFPEYYPMFAETEFEFDGRAPQNTRNRNPLLRLGLGADGLKTGHTEEAGYGLVGSAQQNGRRIIFAVTGIDTQARRAEETEAIVNWAFRHFSEKTIAKADTVIAEADVWMGSEPRVGMVPAEDKVVLLPVLAGGELPAEVVYEGPLSAPIAKGEVIAELVITPDDLPSIRVPLVADREIANGGFIARVGTVAQILLSRLMSGPESPAEAS